MELVGNRRHGYYPVIIVVQDDLAVMCGADVLRAGFWAFKDSDERPLDDC